MIKLLKQLFCKHDKFEKTNIITYYPPSICEARGQYFEYKGLKCTKCGKLFI